jgi:hypothetical protein
MFININNKSSYGVQTLNQKFQQIVPNQSEKH